MYITGSYYLTIFFVAFFALCIIWAWRNYPNLKDWKGELCLSFLLAGLLMWMGGAITKDYVVVEQRNGTIVHNSYECIGSPNIKLCDGTEIDSRQIRTGISGKWIINLTEEDLIEYPLVYGRKGLFKRNVDKVPKPYLIQAGCCLKVRKVPDFQFESVPSSIVADTEWYESLFYSIFGSKKIRWMLDVYNPEQ